MKNTAKFLAGTAIALAATFGSASASDDGLTTFEDYAKMDQPQKDAVQKKAAGVFYKNSNSAVKQCLNDTYIKASPEKLADAYGDLNGYLDARAEDHDPGSSVEGYVLTHLNTVCPTLAGE